MNRGFQVHYLGSPCFQLHVYATWLLDQSVPTVRIVVAVVDLIRTSMGMHPRPTFEVGS